MDRDPETLTVGELARLSGLTPKALRHYHDLGVLAPLRVDSDNGYRLYGREQVGVARQIRVLRELDVPLADIRVIVHNGSPELPESRLRAHRDRLGSRLASLQTSYYFLNKMLEDKESSEIMPKRPTRISLEPDRQRALAAELFNYVWILMETEQRGPRQTQMMVAAAYASRFSGTRSVNRSDSRGANGRSLVRALSRIGRSRLWNTRRPASTYVKSTNSVGLTWDARTRHSREPPGRRRLWISRQSRAASAGAGRRDLRP